MRDDPNVLLSEIRALCKQAAEGDDARRAEREMRWRFEALDRFLSVGGSLPTDWEAAGRTYAAGVYAKGDDTESPIRMAGDAWHEEMLAEQDVPRRYTEWETCDRKFGCNVHAEHRDAGNKTEGKVTPK